MTAFLLGYVLGFFLGATVTAIFVVGASDREIDGNATIEPPWLTEEPMPKTTYKSYAHGVIRQKPKLTLLKNPQPINHVNDISA